MVLDTGRPAVVYAVAFHPDGEHLLGGGSDGIQRWRLSDGQQVTKQTGMTVYAISVSRDGKWIVYGTAGGASVWDGEMREKVIDVESGNAVWAVDVSPDSTRFATGTYKKASIWSIEGGERLVGPLEHDSIVNGLKFSPNGEQIVTACYGRSIRIFNSRNGHELITIDTIIPELAPAIPLLWSSDGQQIFATSNDDKIKSFDASTGSQLAELQIPTGVYSLALASNGKFIATLGRRSIAFLGSISFVDTSTLSRTGPVIEESERIWSIAVSQDSSYLATGRRDGKIAIRYLNDMLADSYGLFHEPQQDGWPSISGSPNGKQDPGNPSHLESDLLDPEVPSSTPAPQSFDYDESMSTASSANLREDEIPPVGSSNVIVQSSVYPPVGSPEEARRQENVESSKTMVIKRWLQTRFRKSNKDSVSDRLSRKSREPADRRSPSHSPPKVDDRQEGPSMMAVSAFPSRTIECAVSNIS
ncbi:WD40-repeat-containing domain protein [Butyriboletus roseoflavus]|nr:WD40-repeat-containing domain protein [Butyriboletus roseoflavus]